MIKCNGSMVSYIWDLIKLDVFGIETKLWQVKKKYFICILIDLDVVFVLIQVLKFKCIYLNYV